MPQNLPGLLKVARPAKRPTDVVVIALQHLLPSLTYLLRRVLDYGFAAQNIWMLGKPYSTIRQTEQILRDSFGIRVAATATHDAFLPGEYVQITERLASEFWQGIMETIGTARDVILLDEGGLLRKTMPARFLSLSHRLVAIEHTSSGWNPGDSDIQLYPVILKARSFAKLRFESPFIARSLMLRLASELKRLSGHGAGEDSNAVLTDSQISQQLAHRTIGIIGFGHLGSTICKFLHSIGVKSLLAYDRDANAFAVPEARFVTQVHRRSDLVFKSEIVLGCTGSALENIEMALFAGTYVAAKHKRLATDSAHSLPPKFFGSCSSGDREFSQLFPYLMTVNRKFRGSAFDNATGQVGEFFVTLFNGGFPLNFDRQREYEPLERIQLTRELTFGSLVQAHQILLSGALSPIPIKLDVAMQMEIVNEWVHRLAKSSGKDVNLLLPKDCEELSIPFAPPMDESIWRLRSEGN